MVSAGFKTARERFLCGGYRQGRPATAERLEQIYGLLTGGGCLCTMRESCGRCDGTLDPYRNAVLDLLATLEALRPSGSQFGPIEAREMLDGFCKDHLLGYTTTGPDSDHVDTVNMLFRDGGWLSITGTGIQLAGGRK